jgi:serine/threonine-protein kinase
VDVDSRYEFLDKVGTGSYATVYRAKDRELGREVAIKQIHQQYLDDPKQLEKYWAEAQLLASLQHPNIVTIFDIYKDRGWLILELMQANLRDRLEGRQMDLRSLRTALAHCLRALKYLHSRGVIHGDIKPSNLMIDHRKRIKLGDFGLARRASDDEGSLLKGTTKYMAPELVSDEFGEVGPQSDLYSLGFTAFELMCGSSFDDLFPGLGAFGRDKQAAWIMWHAAPDRKLPAISRVLEGVPDDLAKVIGKLTEKDPARRYKTADEALSDLNIDLKIVKSEEGESEPHAPKEPAKDNRRTLIAAGAFGLSLLMSLLVLFWPTGEGRHTGPAEPTVGIVRNVDAERRVIEFVDPDSDIPDEIQLPERPDITLLNDDEKILLRRIKPGDWIEIDRRGDADGNTLITLKVARPISCTGRVTSIDSAGERLTVAVTEGRVRDEIPMRVRESTEFFLNGEEALFRDLDVGDEVDADYVLDPSGQRGHWLNALRARRRTEITGFVEALDVANRELTVSFGRGGAAAVTYELADDVEILVSGSPIQLAELQAGDRVRVHLDERVHMIEVTRASADATGVVMTVDDPRGTLVVQTHDGEVITFTLSPDVDVTLHRRGVGIRDLRPEIDSVTVRYDVAEDGGMLAHTIDAHRGTRHDRWALLVGTEAYSDLGVSSIRHAVDDAQILEQVLVERYAVDEGWITTRLDATLHDVNTALDDVLEDAAGMELIIFICGRAYVDENGDGILAFSDFRLADMAGTGMKLSELVSRLEASGAEQVLLYLDVSYDGTGPDHDRIASAETLLANVTQLLTRVTIVGSCSGEERSELLSGGQRGAFVDRLAAAYGGAADNDLDLNLTAGEVVTYLRETLSGTGSDQTPFVRGSQQSQ